MRSAALGVPRLIWVAAMAIVVAAATAIVATRDDPSESRQEAAAAAAGAPADHGTGAIDDGGAASTGQPASSVAGTEPNGAGATGTADTAGERAETTATATSRDRLDPTTTGTALQPVDICDTTPPLTAHPSCPGYRTTTLPTERTFISGTVPITYGGDECHQAPGRVTTTTAPPYCTSSVIPTVTATPTVTTDVCDPNAVSTTHPSCLGDPYFCGSVTTIPTCPARPPGG